MGIMVWETFQLTKKQLQSFTESAGTELGVCERFEQAWLKDHPDDQICVSDCPVPSVEINGELLELKPWQERYLLREAEETQRKIDELLKSLPTFVSTETPKESE